jgi:hypothetical protein
LEAIGDSLIVKYTSGTSLNDYKPQFEDNDAGFKRFHPEIFEASFPQLVKMEDAPTPATSPLARKILPPRPSLPDNPSDKQLSNFKLLSDIHEDYNKNLNEWFDRSWETLDDDDRLILTAKARNLGSQRLGIKDIFSLITGDTYMNVSPAEAEAQIALIRAPLSRLSSLEVNLETRLSYADDLAKACPARALPNGQLYLFLVEVCSSDDLRLVPVIQKFVDRPGYNEHTVVPRDFVDFIVAANRKQMHLPNTGGRAFCDEHGYVPPRVGVGFSVSSQPDITCAAEPSPSALGAASTIPKGGKLISESEFLEYQRLKSAQPALPTAIYCFHHGWQLDHVSSGCSHMMGNNAFTDAQRSYDKPCKAYHPRSIDGKKANIDVAPGCKKPAFWKQ